ncbi:hypothetical protein PtrSN002B_003115 [Pyrenophora tritici-repentis]|uniref:Uncharacterized protein n=2 Tax=Pyrenophora tritici-repentis TaxID=45151 RepID=A0A2W1G1T4_9PLEO|nr:hypothetical protein PtrV1_13020 [Pyrenophora tritici-repentis]KAF7447023.1 hypothetical protein A1F99_084700 [Pyrenophora tritici-repentis]KAG9382914.1 hypothetical protein A1F94_006835 [Pyrenophora tritici-repentis]KAI0581990.1 hypothetical protein Alg130_06335 [Pyrenophora tritici-repentis]KAI0585930.1 hypothetical protein Alg215_02285 [Pyrenophora tritici-repentis]
MEGSNVFTAGHSATNQPRDDGPAARTGVTAEENTKMKDPAASIATSLQIITMMPPNKDPTTPTATASECSTGQLHENPMAKDPTSPDATASTTRNRHKLSAEKVLEYFSRFIKANVGPPRIPAFIARDRRSIRPCMSEARFRTSDGAIQPFFRDFVDQQQSFEDRLTEVDIRALVFWIYLKYNNIVGNAQVIDSRSYKLAVMVNVVVTQKMSLPARLATGYMEEWVATLSKTMLAVQDPWFDVNHVRGGD